MKGPPSVLWGAEGSEATLALSHMQAESDESGEEVWMCPDKFLDCVRIMKLAIGIIR